MSDDPTYCSLCYDAARKAGRAVRQTDVYTWPVCSLCESRLRNGLVHYVPSNGTEGHIFLSRCDECRHFRSEDFKCAHGVLDKVMDMMFELSDSAKAWHDPATLQTRVADGSPRYPALCLRFTDRNDPLGDLRDPPPKDCVGQMMLEEVLDVPERVPAVAATH